MRAPNWIAGVVRDFGRGAGIGDFELNDRGTAAFRFENGFCLRFEYGDDQLAVLVTVPAANGPATARRLLSYAHPDARHGARVRACYLAKSGCAAFAVRLAAADVTLPAVDAAFGALWRVAKEFGGAA
jgi:type III secretion system chaperone SycN